MMLLARFASACLGRTLRFVLVRVPWTGVPWPLFIVVACVATRRSAAEELASFPVTVWAGIQDASAERGAILPDVRFSTERGYGHVGGTPHGEGREAERSVTGPPGRERPLVRPCGGSAQWPVSWREGVKKYTFRVPRGKYLVELTFLETEVGAAGARVFDVLAEGSPTFRGVDIAALAGEWRWVTLKAVVGVYDGWLDLSFQQTRGRHPPRVSRLRIEPLDPAPGVIPGVARLEASGAPGSVLLRWEAAKGGKVGGYGVFRAAAPNGTFEALTQQPLPEPVFVDRDVEWNQPYFYKVCALGLDGRQGRFSASIEARPFTAYDLGLAVYDLYLLPEDLARLKGWTDEDVEVAAELKYRGKTHHVLLRRDVSRVGARKRSYLVSLDRERSRLFRDRRHFFLSAEADDPTLLREFLSARVAKRLDLPSPVVEPVALVINDEYAGLYFDIEPIDRRFLRRRDLDRSGMLARLLRGDEAFRSWEPVGEKLGKTGSPDSLNRFAQEIQCLGAGEFRRFLDQRLYLDRYLKRQAFGVLRGVRAEEAEDLFLLRDARNGKWEFLEGSYRRADWSVNAAEDRSPGEWAEEARGLLSDSSASVLPLEQGWGTLWWRVLQQQDLRKRVRERVEEDLKVGLPPDVFQKIVTDAFGEIEAAAAVDPAIWLCKRRHAEWLAGPERLVEAYRHRAQAIQEVLDGEFDRLPTSLVIRQLTALPGAADRVVTGAARSPWVEIHNPSSRVISLRRAFLTDARRAGRRLQLPDVQLGPGALHVVELPPGPGPQLRPEGGFVGILLARDPPTSSLDLVDGVYYGRQTPGFSYSRVGRSDPAAGSAGTSPRDRALEGQSRRTYAFVPTGGVDASESEDGPQPPPYGYRQGLTPSRSGDVTIWLRPDWLLSKDRPADSTIELRYRKAGDAAFARVSLEWNVQAFRHEVTLGANPDRGATTYYFVATNDAGLERAYPLPGSGLEFEISVLPPVRINEVLPRPLTSGSASAEKDVLDFIELYNASETPVDISGMYLSDSRSHRTKWRIPAGNVIPPKGFVVFFASNLNRGNHTNFRLNNSGEFLGLFSRIHEGSLAVDRITFRALLPGQSWGREKDGAKGLRVWRDPTPGAPNLPKIPAEYLEKNQE